MKLAIGLTNADLDRGWFVHWPVDPSHFETSHLSNDSTVIVDRPRPCLAQNRRQLPHFGAEYRRSSDRHRLGRDEFHTVNGNDIDAKRLDVAHSAGKRTSVLGFSNEVQMIHLGPQRPDQRRPSHPLVGGVEHAVSTISSSVGRRDETPGYAEGIVHDQF